MQMNYMAGIMYNVNHYCKIGHQLYHPEVYFAIMIGSLYIILFITWLITK